MTWEKLGSSYFKHKWRHGVTLSTSLFFSSGLAVADVREAQFLVPHEAVSVEAWVEGDGVCGHSSVASFGAGTGQVEDLHHIEHQRDASHN